MNERVKTMPRKGEKWVHVEHGTVCRVMAESIEGYVVARNKGAVPFVVHVNEWHKRFVLAKTRH